MTQAELIEGFRARLTLYAIDEQARQTMKQAWVVVAPVLEQAVDDFLLVAEKIPRLSEIVIPNRSLIKKLETAHFESLLGGQLDERYIASCLKTVQEEAAIGFDGRVRSSAGNFLLRTIMTALQRNYRFSTSRFAEHSKTVSKFIAFDVANAMSLHRTAAEQANNTRRQAIDEAIGDFATAIGDVVGAIQEAAASLGSTSVTLQKAADDTVGRMVTASLAATETKQRVEATATATEEISTSIQHIGERTTRGLDMARSAVGDTQRTRESMRSLNEATEHIGSVVGLISTIASQTNLLALNATIEAARAGQEGRGFAVVASEVKALATQTSQATEVISQQVAAIQEATTRSLEEISSIAAKMDQLTEVASDIATAVEEQSSTSREIAGSIQAVASNTAQATTEILSVQQAATQSAAAVGEITGWTTRLSSRANDLETKVARFFAQVRAA